LNNSGFAFYQMNSAQTVIGGEVNPLSDNYKN